MRLIDVTLDYQSSRVSLPLTGTTENERYAQMNSLSLMIELTLTS